MKILKFVCLIEIGSRYTIASFDYNENDLCFELNSCCDRLKSKKIDWEVFGLLVQKGYKILNERCDG